MLRQNIFLNDKGFTLIEIIAVMIVIGILATVAVPRYIDLGANARKKAIQTAISEINAREKLTWAEQKISTSGFVSDAKIFEEVNYEVNPNYSWNSGDPTVVGGTLNFKGESFTLSRSASSSQIPAVWRPK